MDEVLERFLKYVRFDTQSDENSGTHPSTQGQLKMAAFLAEELEQMGLEGVQVTDKGYVYAYLSPEEGLEDVPALGLIAHMDTSDAASGFQVKPQIVENWDGKPVALGSSGILLEPEKKLLHHTLVTTDGTTLLGADDKAGIAVIMTAVGKIIRSKIPHGKICVGFTPDEEIGAGADFFDVPLFGAQYAYTVDAGDEALVECENFNASSAVVRFKGLSVHPGSAKGIMINAQKVAFEFDSLLPEKEIPSCTEGREGFYHLTSSAGTVSSAELHYILRDHDAALFEQRKAKIREVARSLNEKYGPGTVAVTLKEQYRNMLEVMEKYPFLVEIAERAVRSVGIEPVLSPIRGGTDGARLCFMGLPCPNIGYGGYNAHGEREYVDVAGLNNAVDIVLHIIREFASGSAAN
ncbi:MAG: peptidase T [Lentisphaeria bacterium]|nr:peptidase T [Lentisphaeria bacterium]